MRKLLYLFWIIITWLLYPFLSFKAKKVTQDLGSTKRILVVPQITRIGDIVCSTPVFYNLKKFYPDCYLVVLVSKKAVGIIKNNKRIDEIIILEEYSKWELIKKIREVKINWAINLSATSTNTCLFVWSYIANRIKTVVETPPPTEVMTDWLANKKLLYKNHTYLPHHHLRLLNFVDINTPEDKKEVWLSPDAEEKARNLREAINPTHKIIGVSITAGNKIKELGIDKWLDIINDLLKIPKVVILCIGSPKDSELIKNFIKEVNNEKCREVTNFSLEELPSLIKILSLYIAVDTGPIYIAHALGVPLIDIIGPVDPTEQPPSDEKSIQILPNNNIKPSSFVFKRRGTVGDIEAAIRETEVDKIVSAAKQLLK